ncbi:hypothetical protein HPB48_014329 [Haemaphysalis longicornis]|uniref:Ig-like domain-containing protein n=1 Tax=Haemaphysalis longicornis TaxID=44386 RepID=A0A9J6G347_HAELO|nr:hypothetical protein HPB48_014329 [Haemaphysalis longicornis]
MPSIREIFSVKQPIFLSPIATIQAAEGDDAVLTCLVDNLGSHKVSWYRTGSGELLSFDTRMLTSDTRVRTEHSRPSSWQLRVAREATQRQFDFPTLLHGQTPRQGNFTEAAGSPKEENIASSRSKQKTKVAWLNVDKQTLLALHTHVIVQNERIRVSHGSLRVWQLEIRDVRPEDTGYYMCQVNTRPMKNQVGYLNVVGEPPSPCSLSWKKKIARAIHSRWCIFPKEPFAVLF